MYLCCIFIRFVLYTMANMYPNTLSTIATLVSLTVPSLAPAYTRIHIHPHATQTSLYRITIPLSALTLLGRLSG